MTLVTVTDLTKSYAEKCAVDDVSFSLVTGQTVALIGPNGAGKTTIMRMLAGLTRPTSGNINFPGLPAQADVRSLIGYLPQYPHFFPWMTGREFLIFAGELGHLARDAASERADLLLDKVGLTTAKDDRTGTYSGGMKQRLGIAQAIIHQPKLLLLDEPVSSLDPLGRRDVLALLNVLKEDMTILLSTHILSDAEQICDHLLLLYDGQLVQAGSLEDVKARYRMNKMALRFSVDPRPFQASLRALPGVIDVTIIDKTLSVHVTQLAEAREAILRLAGQEKWPLLQFIVQETTLEDIFMQVVDK